MALGAGASFGDAPAESPAPGKTSDPASSSPRFRFVDVAAQAGMTRVLLAGRPGMDHLLDSAGAGAGWLDYDGDGKLDAYIVNGWRLDGDRVVEKGRNALYRNRGDGTFEDVTDRAGVGGEGQWGSGVAIADYDGDGRPDILVTNFGPNVLYHNRGDGTFENVAAAAGVESPGWNTGAAFFDADGDGDLDLYVASYIDCTMQDVLAAKPTLEWKGVAKVAVGPFGLKGASDHFFLNDGHGHFTDATETSGMKDLALGFGFTVRAGDVNGDGRPDLYVANDSDANYLYRNEGGGHFRDTGLWSGTAVDVNGSAQAGMGVAFGDVDGDGIVDILVTNFSEDFSTLYRGTGGGFYEDVSAPSGVGPATFLSLSWGALLADLDNDGDEDIVIANGHIYPQIDAHPETGLTFNEKNLLLENDGHGHFTDVTDQAGPGFAEKLSSRGLAAGDFDDDGDVDLLITNVNAPPSLLRNDSPGGAWLTVVLDPEPGKGTIVGARVTVQAGGKKMIRDLASSGSYMSAHDPRLHFGLGAAAKADVVQVDWPGGARTIRRDVAARTVLHLSRGD